jgi:hypothetical protein
MTNRSKSGTSEQGRPLVESAIAAYTVADYTLLADRVKTGVVSS